MALPEIPSQSSHRILFATLVEFLNGVASRPPRPAKTRSCSTLANPHNQAALDFQTWVQSIEWPAPLKTGAIIFRLLFPEQDVRRRYNLQETQLAKALATVLQVSIGPGRRGEGLLRWKENREDMNGVELGRDGCLGLEVEKIRREVESVPNSSQQLDLTDVDRLLDELAAHSRWSNLGSTSFQQPLRHRLTVLKDLYASLSARECAFMTQIILQDLRPLLYPLPSSSTYKALLDYNSSSYEELDPYLMMKAWHWAMPRIYPFKADFDKAADLCAVIPRDPSRETPVLEKLVNALCRPEVGTPVRIPKAVKASGACLAASLSRLSGAVWAETKMDGERMQIHVDVSRPLNEQIQIFSKNHRDSTKERRTTHLSIRTALGLPTGRHSNSQLFPPSPRPNSLSNVKTGIFEAEMVAWNMTLGKVDEFWRISELKLKPWQTVNAMDQPSQQRQELFTQDAGRQSSGHCRHLALFFFDVLFLNGESLIHLPYVSRRKKLEDTIHIIPHYSMLVDRKQFHLGSPSGLSRLREHFAAIIAERHEGLVIKPAYSRYNDTRLEHRWHKVKKDYIVGFGDTADYAVIGAGWDKDRARELRVSTATYTSWFVGAQENFCQTRSNPSVQPRFSVIFKVLSYGLSRERLEKLNQVARNSEGAAPDSIEMSKWPFTFSLPPIFGSMKVVFKTPMVFELMGSGFTKKSRRHEYELRWPRITKVYEPQERSWEDALDLDGHNAIARCAVRPHPQGAIGAVQNQGGGRSKTAFVAELESWFYRLEEADRNWETRKLRNGQPQLNACAIPAPRPARHLSRGFSQLPDEKLQPPNSIESPRIPVLLPESPACHSLNNQPTSDCDPDVTRSPLQGDKLLHDALASPQVPAQLTSSSTVGGASSSSQLGLSLRSLLEEPRGQTSSAIGEIVDSYRAQLAGLVLPASSASDTLSRSKSDSHLCIPSLVPVSKRKREATEDESVVSSKTRTEVKKLRRPRLVVFRRNGRDTETAPCDASSFSFSDQELPSKRSKLRPSPSRSGTTANNISSSPRESAERVSFNYPVGQRHFSSASCSVPGLDHLPTGFVQTTGLCTSNNEAFCVSTNHSRSQASPPPWRLAEDFSWCLPYVNDNSGIGRGTRYRTVSELLQHLEVKPKHYYSNSKPPKMNYVFVPDPNSVTITRIKKQIIFRALSDPNAAIVGYDAKVLNLNQGNEETWKSYELFRFNSYDEDYRLEQIRLQLAT